MKKPRFREAAGRSALDASTHPDKNIRPDLKLIKYPAIVARKLQDGLIHVTDC